MDESTRRPRNPKPHRKRRLAIGLAGAMVATAAAGLAATTASAQTDTLKVMSLNTWHGGGQVDDGANKIVTQIRGSGAEAVALQETTSEGAKSLADKLGWHSTQSGSDVDVISKYPIEDSASHGKAAGAKIQGVWVYSAHLAYDPYGPYNACFDQDSYEEIDKDEQTRKSEAQDIAQWAGSEPAIVAGDFNSPSHQDWTGKTRDQHCNSVVNWPATRAFTDRGYTDSFRETNPDEAQTPGNTWSPVQTWNSDYDKAEPQDRIDFVMYQGGALDATDSMVYGGDSKDWPSDHRAVLSTFSLGG